MITRHYRFEGNNGKFHNYIVNMEEYRGIQIHKYFTDSEFNLPTNNLWVTPDTSVACLVDPEIYPYINLLMSYFMFEYKTMMDNIQNLIRIRLTFDIIECPQYTLIKYKETNIKNIYMSEYRHETWIYYHPGTWKAEIRTYSYVHNDGIFDVSNQIIHGCYTIDQIIHQHYVGSKHYKYSAQLKMLSDIIVDQLHDIYHPILLKHLLSLDILFEPLCKIIASYCV